MKSIIFVISIFYSIIFIGQENVNGKIFINYSLCLNSENSVIFPSVNNREIDVPLSYNSFIDNKMMNTIIDGFISNIKSNKNLENKIWDIPNATLNGLSLRFDQVADIYSPKISEFYVIDHNWFEPKSAMKVNFDAKNNSVLFDKNVFMKFDNEKSDWILYKPVYEKSGNFLTLKSDPAKSIGMLKELAASVDFFESWEIDVTKGTFIKEVFNLGISIWGENHGNEHELLPVFNFKTNPYLKETYTNSIQNEYKTKDLNIISDSLFYYTMLCYNSKRNNQNYLSILSSSFDNDNCYYYIEPIKRFYLIDLAFQCIKNKTAKAYFVNGTIDFKNELDIKGIADKLLRTDTVMIEDINTYELLERVVSSERNISDIVAFGFNESWYFDKESFGIFKKVDGIFLIFREFGSYNYETSEVKNNYRPKIYIDFN
ncbi:MAG: hypothetical protein ABIJ97_14550 [Bacteroidota bacterium]